MFFSYSFLGFSVFVVPLPPLRGHHTVLCRHPRWHPHLRIGRVCHVLGRSPGTTDLPSGALPLSHLSSKIVTQRTSLGKNDPWPETRRQEVQSSWVAKFLNSNFLGLENPTVNFYGFKFPTVKGTVAWHFFVHSDFAKNTQLILWGVI